MIDYCKLVWKVKGFMFQKDDFRLEDLSKQELIKLLKEKERELNE